MNRDHHLNYLMSTLVYVVGCQSCKPTPTPPVVVEVRKAKTVQVVGLVNKPGEVLLSLHKPTLKAAIAAAGGTTVSKDFNNQDQELFARFLRGNKEYYVALTTISETVCGEIIVESVDKIEVLKWNETDLFRGLAAGKPVSIPETPGEGAKVAEILEWYHKLTGKVTEENRKHFDKATTEYDRANALRLIARGYGGKFPKRDDEAGLADWLQNFIKHYIQFATKEQIRESSIVIDKQALTKSYGTLTKSKLLKVDFSNEAGTKKINDNELSIAPDFINAPRFSTLRDEPN